MQWSRSRWTMWRDRGGRLPANGSQFDLALSATYDPQLLAQLPGVLLHEAYFRVYSIQPWTLVRVEHRGKAATAWLVPIERRRLLQRQDFSWSASGWVSANLAKRLEIKRGETTMIRVFTALSSERVQPARIGNYIPSDTIVTSAATRRAFGRRVLIASGSRVAVVSTSRRRSKQQTDGTARLNFHLRRTLNLVPDPSTSRQYVQLSTYRRAQPRLSLRRAGVWVLSSPLSLLVTIAEQVGRLLLRAPRVSLACEESLTNDDTHGVARLSQGAAELLGVTPGDSAYFYFGRNRIRLRTLILEDYRPHERPEQSVVDWTPDFDRPPADAESVVCIPGKARSLIGVPRNGIVVARRSIVSILRRRLIALTLPFVAVGVSVAKLDLEPLQAILLITGAVILTLAGDRIPTRSWRR